MVDNKVKIGNTSYCLKAVKMKYIKDGFYMQYKMLKDIGLVAFVSKYADGIDGLNSFLKAIFDKEKIPDELLDNLDRNVMNEILEKVAKINEIKDEDSKNVQRTPKA